MSAYETVAELSELADAQAGRFVIEDLANVSMDKQGLEVQVGDRLTRSFPRGGHRHTRATGTRALSEGAAMAESQVELAEAVQAEVASTKDSADRLANGDTSADAYHVRVLARMVRQLADQGERLAGIWITSGIERGTGTG